MTVQLVEYIGLLHSDDGLMFKVIDNVLCCLVISTKSNIIKYDKLNSTILSQDQK